MYKYYILAFILGCLLKIYDDLYDNNLYAFFNISKEKSYINEFLKISIIMAGTVLSMNFYMFYILIVLFNTTTYLIKPSEYGRFELSGLFACYLLLPFIQWKNDTCTENIIYVALTILGTIFIEKHFINIEYSCSKLVYRLVCGLLSVLGLMANIIKNQGTVVFVIVGSTYLLTSCIFQYILITYEKEIQQSNLKNKKRKKLK